MTAKATMLDQRERDTIIAALRLWQAMRGKVADTLGSTHASDLEEIAENGRNGGDAALLDDEIDALIEERINT